MGRIEENRQTGRLGDSRVPHLNSQAAQSADFLQVFLNFQISSIIVLYTGPYVQYSNTVTGYETGDIYYGLRLFALTTSDVDSTSYNMINDDDAYVQEQNKKYGDFIKSNSPKSSIGLNLTVGWRFSG